MCRPVSPTVPPIRDAVSPVSTGFLPCAPVGVWDRGEWSRVLCDDPRVPIGPRCLGRRVGARVPLALRFPVLPSRGRPCPRNPGPRPFGPRARLFKSAGPRTGGVGTWSGVAGVRGCRGRGRGTERTRQGLPRKDRSLTTFRRPRPVPIRADPEARGGAARPEHPAPESRGGPPRPQTGPARAESLGAAAE